MDGPPKTDDGPLDLSQETQRLEDSKRTDYSPRKVQRDSSGSFQSEGNLEMDIDEKPENELVYSCLLCGEKFNSTQILSDHLIIHHNYYDPIDFESLKHQYGDGEFPENMMEAETVFCCEICYREFNDRASLWLHMLYSHRDDAAKACGVCLKICPDNESLIQHVGTVHPREKQEQRRYSCQVCSRQHDSKKKLVTHARIHKLTDPEGNLVDPETIVVLNSEFYGEGPPPAPPSNDGFLSSCDICFKVFENEAKLSKHKRSTHKDGMNNSSANNYNFFFACELCGLSHLSRPERWKHMATSHEGDPAVTCNQKSCGKVFPTSSIKKEHEATHHATQGEFPNTCEVCGKMWKTRVEYWKHMMGVHSESLPFICGVCLKVFTELQNLVTHVRNSHWPLVGGDFCCDVCGRPYSKISKMSRHRKIHFQVDTSPELRELLRDPKMEQEQQHFLQNHTTSLTCDLCVGVETKEEFENIETLGKHRLQAHNVMPCDLCTKYYGRTSHLWKHVNKIHKGHPDITCPVCQRTSASRAHLATHIVKHHRSDESGEKDIPVKDENEIHTCEKCSKIFRKGALMRKHLKHCKGPRPVVHVPPPVNGVYTCERCPKTFAALNLLNKHMRSSHVTFKCEICEVKSNTKTELFNHVVAEHSDHPDLRCAQTGCDKILRCKSDLDRHQRDHRSSTQLHYCRFCAEIVTAKVKLKMHLKAQHAKEAKHLCAVCLKVLENYDDLRSHIVDQHKVLLARPNTCQVCAKPCSSRSKLMDHIRNHGPEFHPCKLCYQIFPTKEDLDTHSEHHPVIGAGEEPITEDIDDEDETVDEVDDLDTNSIIDIIGAPKGHVEKVESLDAKSIRDIIGAAQGNVKLNRVSESDKEEDAPPAKKAKIMCEKCPTTFGSQTELKAHMLTAHKAIHPKKSFLLSHDKENAKLTSDPNEKFMNQLGLVPEVEKKKREIRRVFDDDFTPSPCELCEKVWPAKRHLWQHYIRFHKNDAGRCCGVCLKLCSNYTSLCVHLAVHHRKNFDGDGSNMSCKVCGKYHNARGKLQNHSVIHFGHEERAMDSVHHCLICKSIFPVFPLLIEHLQKEHELATTIKLDPEEEKPLETSALTQNKETKSAKTPFLSCEVCSLVFATEIGLANHKRTHEHSDSFKCGQCGEFFGSVDALKVHKSAKHQGSEFVCAECKSNFQSYEQLALHNKSCLIKRKSAVESELEDEEDVDSDEIDTTAANGGSGSDENEDDSSLCSDEDDDEVDAEEDELDPEDDIEEDVGTDEDVGDEEGGGGEEDVDDEEDVGNEDVEDDENSEEEDSEPIKEEPKEIRAIEAFIHDTMGDNMVEVVKIDLSDDIDGAVKAS